MLSSYVKNVSSNYVTFVLEEETCTKDHCYRDCYWKVIKIKSDFVKKKTPQYKYFDPPLDLETLPE